MLQPIPKADALGNDTMNSSFDNDACFLQHIPRFDVMILVGYETEVPRWVTCTIRSISNAKFEATIRKALPQKTGKKRESNAVSLR